MVHSQVSVSEDTKLVCMFPGQFFKKQVVSIGVDAAVASNFERCWSFAERA